MKTNTILVFGKWTILKTKIINQRKRCFCVCMCGTSKWVRLDVLKNGNSKQCRTCADTSLRTHGETHKTPEWKVWVEMRNRCYNPKFKYFADYGGRGISVAAEWVGPLGYQRFLTHVGRRPSNRHSLDRIDNNGNYAPGNVRWATKKEQARNRRSNVLMTLDGTTKSMAAWSEELEMPYAALNQRFGKLGWDEESVLTTPIHRARQIL